MRSYLIIYQMLLFGVLIACCTSLSAQQPIVSADESVIARYDYTPHATQQGVGELTLELRDAITSQPLDYTGKRLAGWLQRSPKTLADAELQCSDKVRALASQGIGRRAAVDFNTYSLVTVNSDRTVAFINPFLKLNNAKLEGVVSLIGDATAALHHTAARELWVAMRDSDAIAVIDTDTRQLKRNIVFAAGAKPQSMALMGQAVWVSFAGRDAWLRFDSSASEQPDAKVDAPAGAQLVADTSGATLMGTGAQGLSLLKQGGTTASKVNLVNKVSGVSGIANAIQATSAVWSELSKRWIIGTSNSGTAQHELLLINEGAVTQRIALNAPATQLHEQRCYCRCGECASAANRERRAACHRAGAQQCICICYQRHSRPGNAAVAARCTPRAGKAGAYQCRYSW
jgi:hypothetical protein